MPDDAGLTGEDDVVADAGASGDAGLGDDEAVLSDLDVVRNLDEVIDFRSFTDDGSPEAGAVDGGVCADFNIVFNDDDSALGDFGVFALDFFETKSVTSDDGAGVEDDAVADFATVKDRGAGVEVAVCADVGMVTEVALGFEDGVCADSDVGLDDAEGADTGGGRDFCGGVDGSGGMDSGLAFGRFWGELLSNCGERGRWVFYKNADGPCSNEGSCFWGGNEDNGGFGVSKLFDVAGIGEEGEITWACLVERGEAVNEYLFGVNILRG